MAELRTGCLAREWTLLDPRAERLIVRILGVQSQEEISLSRRSSCFVAIWVLALLKVPYRLLAAAYMEDFDSVKLVAGPWRAVSAKLIKYTRFKSNASYVGGKQGFPSIDAMCKAAISPSTSDFKRYKCNIVDHWLAMQSTQRSLLQEDAPPCIEHYALRGPV